LICIPSFIYSLNSAGVLAWLPDPLRIGNSLVLLSLFFNILLCISCADPISLNVYDFNTLICPRSNWFYVSRSL